MDMTKRLWLLAVALLVSACSFTKLAYMNAAMAYSNATPVLAWLVDDYIDMSGSQKGWVKSRIRDAMAWHREQELPEYRRFVEALIVKVEDGVSVEEAREAHRTLRGYYHRALGHVIPDLAELLVQLDAEQATQLERKFADENRKLVRESVKGSPRERFEKRVERYLEHIEEFTGKLSEPQRELVAAHLKPMAELNDERMGDRRYRQAELMAMVRTQPSREQAAAQLRRLLIETETWRRPEYQEKLRDRDERMFEMIAALSTTLTAEQRSHMKARLRGFVRDLSELTAGVEARTGS
jgi:hypothetical protein